MDVVPLAFPKNMRSAWPEDHLPQVPAMVGVSVFGPIIHRRQYHATTTQATAKASRTKIGANGRVGSSSSRTSTIPAKPLAKK